MRNLASARHINIAHGLYPREPLTERALSGLVNHLAVGTNVIDGRTYAGGLTKFEPREMERLFVPGLDVLEGGGRLMRLLCAGLPTVRRASARTPT